MHVWMPSVQPDHRRMASLASRVLTKVVSAHKSLVAPWGFHVHGRCLSEWSLIICTAGCMCFQHCSAQCSGGAQSARCRYAGAWGHASMHAASCCKGMTAGCWHGQTKTLPCGLLSAMLSAWSMRKTLNECFMHAPHFLPGPMRRSHARAHVFCGPSGAISGHTAEE